MTAWVRWGVALLLALAGVRIGAQPLVEIPRGTLQAASEAAHEVELPHKLYRPQRVFAPYRFETGFQVDAGLAEVRAMLQLDSWPDGGRILVNGVEVANLATSTELVVVRYLRPFAFLLPAGLLRPGENRLVIEWGSRETLVLVPRLRVGPRSAIEARFERQLFWEYTAVQASLVFAAVVALVTLGVWWQQRRRAAPPEYLLIGIGALGWIVFNGALLWSPVPADWFLWRRVIGIAGIGLFVLGMWVCLARLAGAVMRRFEIFAALWVAAGPVLLTAGHLWTGATHLPTFEAVWSVGAAALGTVPLVVLVRAVWRAPTARLALLLGFALVALGLAAREAAIYLLRDPIGTLHLGLQILAPLWLATACGILVQDFVRSLRAAQAQREALDLRLAEREAELARLHAREREHATDEERRRIMQDMHDGLGSQLVSSLVLAERGHLSPLQTADLLRGCIDDLRLAIDTLSDGAIDLALAAGNLRFRMEPRLRAAGIRLRWDTAGLPDDLQLPGSVALPLLRVLQEALTNALKHAGASELQVRLALAAGRLQLDVVDDGRGFSLDGHAPGKGLVGMRKRARGLGGELAIEPSAQGTRVRLDLPCEATAAPLRPSATG